MRVLLIFFAMAMSAGLASAEVIKLKCRNKREAGIDDSYLSFWVDTKKNTVTNDRKIAEKAAITKQSISWVSADGEFRTTVDRGNGDMEVVSTSRKMSIGYTCIKVLDAPAF